MSIFTEYAALIPKGMLNLPYIIDGLKNQRQIETGVMPKDQLAIIIDRRMICGSCEFMSKNANGYESERKDEHCIHCGCPILIRTASLKSNCGLENYNVSHHKDVPLKWQAVKTYFKNFLKK